MAYLQIFVLAAVSVAVLAQDKCDPANCQPCEHGQTPFCDHHDNCHCRHNTKRATCSEDVDCTSTPCGRGEYGACRVLHGSGDGLGEKGCICVHHKRAAGCCQSSDCDAAALGCDSHHEVATCELKHGSGQGCGENVCKCVAKHG